MAMRWCALWLLILLAQAGSACAGPDLEARIAEIEQRNMHAPWPQSAALIEALGDDLAQATPEQRARIELVRLRNLALAGDNRGCVDGVEALLKQELSPTLRLRALGLGANVAVNIGDYFRAFSWLKQGLAEMPEQGKDRTALLGHAAYLYAMAGEGEQALTYARQALLAADQSDDPRARCLARADLSLALESAGQLLEAERTRREQFTVCSQAGDPVFVAQALGGLGIVQMKQGYLLDALAPMREARRRYQAANFLHGVSDTGIDIAEVLVRLDRNRDEAEQLLNDSVAALKQSEAWGNLARVLFLHSELAERRGDTALALDYRKQAEQAGEKEQAEIRDRRFAYLQVEFNSQVAEQQIALLQRDQSLQQLRLKEASQRQWLIVAVVVVLLAILSALAYSLRRTRNERLRYRWLSERDGLTRLYNHQQAYRLGQLAYAGALGAAKPFTVIMADIDLFKQLNDRYGHAMGDEVLRRLGEWWRAVFGENTVVGRSGGEEFTAFLPVDAAAAHALVTQLQQRIEPVSAWEQTVKPTLSFGICERNERHKTLADVVRCADQALYRAKHGGRDQVVLATAAEPEHTASAQAQLDGPGLVVVGSGIQMSRHVSERTLSEIRAAQCVFCLVDPLARAQILELRPDAIDLAPLYATGKDRRQTYREMETAIMTEVRAGRRVCAVFYGHPGVFADVPHVVIRKARAEGISARMEPGISAEACLYADLGIDPGRSGVLSLEATHFMVYQHTLDTSTHLLLWQVALSGDLTCSRFHAEAEGLRALVKKLSRWYPFGHEVILYEAAVMPIQHHRAERLALRDLPMASYKEFTTLVIPPLHPAQAEPAAQ
ncbi:MAG: tetrapyrrole methylase [Gammaproteobacteria bacterium HGW-Gammaproteobacteria-4]|jgi:diguanylate cyclase (GGDEF)-like protein|nr:MAG: tetrapyrrole methylase [Gammaproteobacteria bacterium HGW-Gammaproteobacteria-4]